MAQEEQDALVQCDHQRPVHIQSMQQKRDKRNRSITLAVVHLQLKDNLGRDYENQHVDENPHCNVSLGEDTSRK